MFSKQAFMNYREHRNSEYPIKTQAEYAEFDHESQTVAENMEQYGGSFVKRLGKALHRADANNAQRIKDAFPEYWDEYLNFKN